MKRNYDYSAYRFTYSLPPDSKLLPPAAPQQIFFFGNILHYSILAMKPTSCIILYYSRKSIMYNEYSKARKNNILSIFQLSIGFFNKKAFQKVREGAEKTITYKLSSSSYTHIAAHHQCPSYIFMTQNINNGKNNELILEIYSKTSYSKNKNRANPQELN